MFSTTTNPTPNITLYTSATPNSFKISIALEELALPYTARAVNLTTQEQKEPWLLEYNPNGRLPTLTDHDTRVFESGAILLYLVQKYDPEGRISYKPEETPGYTEMLSWLMWQMGGLGPMQGQAHHFTAFAPVRSSWGIERYTTETRRLYDVLNTRLTESPFLAGDRFTIADIATYSWVRASPNLLDFQLGEWPAIQRWHDGIAGREAVQRALKVPGSSITEDQFAEIVREKRRVLMGWVEADVR
ncbi:glutathione S-transferase [Aspergillus ellipticus CBS 707.79]|uniref:Glutathione S-transferase n=1 Tax=Aspergillus ellipticus CBS 707.79 TaxID=1448320 RepID=A0A319DIB7_9EURO|nr:glutathione S-transferase [Aspergillus ellipticus CBS 707.79]